jgi:hypothetical protein
VPAPDHGFCSQQLINAGGGEKLHPRFQIFQFESSHQPHRQFAGAVLRMGWFYCGSTPQVGRKPTPRFSGVSRELVPGKPFRTHKLEAARATRLLADFSKDLSASIVKMVKDSRNGRPG